MNKLLFKLRIFTISLAVVSCGSTEGSVNELTPVDSKTSISEVDYNLQNFFTSDYKYTKINFTQGNLEDAFNQAKESNKKLFVIASLPDCSLCDMAFKVIDVNENISKEKLDDFLFYKSEFSNEKEKYLLCAFNQIGAPVAFVFSPEADLINILVGMTDINKDDVIDNLDNIREGKFNKRLNLEGESAISFMNNQIKAYRIFVNPSSEVNDLNDALRIVESSLIKQDYVFNEYLKQELSKKLNLPVSKENKYFQKDQHSQFIYNTLIN